MKRVIMSFCVFLFFVFVFVYIKDLSFFGNITRTGQPPLDYENIFNQEAKKDLMWGETYESDNRNPISTGVYGFNKNLNLMFYVYKIQLSSNASLKDIVGEQNIPYLIKDENFYQNIVAGFEFKYLKDSIKPVSNIYLTFDGAVRTIIKNDSIAEYYSTVHDFSMRYALDGNADIFVKARDSNTDPNNIITIGIILFKKNAKLYMVVMEYKKNEILADSVMPHNLISVH